MNIPRKTLTKNLTDLNNLQKITMSSFVSFFVKASIIKEVGLPIKEFFIWTDDWEYSRRISRKYDCYFVPNSIVTHKSNNNMGANIASESIDRLDRFNYLYRNDYYLYKREGIRGLLYLYPRLLVHIIRIIKSDKKDKKERINIIIRATRNGRKFNPKIEYID
jgi:GT2 family glycosyltransferase